MITMIVCRIRPILQKQYKNSADHIQRRNVQVSIVGAGNNIGSNLALLMKQSCKVGKLQLYDVDERVKGIGMELEHIRGGPIISTYVGDSNLGAAIRNSDLVVLVSRVPRKPGFTRGQMININAPIVHKVCRTMADHNPNAFLAMSTNPINSLIPFASALMYHYGCYNPFKILGITHIDAARSRAYAAGVLQADVRCLQVPVIGGHSDETIVPLFSNLTPNHYSIDACQADTLTRLVRKAGAEVLNRKKGTESATLAMAWSINEFVNSLVDAIWGYEVIVNTYTSNPHFGTRFFAGPTSVGPTGIIRTCGNMPMSEYESYLLNKCVPVLNREVAQGEEIIHLLKYA